jgi:hypothetical protein
MTDVWDRLPEESGDAWESFRNYRNAGPQRTMADTARKMGRKPGTFYKLARIYRWEERARAYDEHIEAIDLKKTEILTEVNAERRIKLARGLQEVALSRIEEWRRDVSEGAIPPLSPTEVAKLAEVGVKLERMEIGESTENVAIQGRVTSLTEKELMDRAREILAGRV